LFALRRFNSAALIVISNPPLRFVFEFSRRWFLIRYGQLLYMKRNNANMMNDNTQQHFTYSVMVPDLRLCTIRLSNDHDRRFVFEIISPNR
jgi:hypothetical protein